MDFPKEIDVKLEELFLLCIKYKVQKLFVFGSLSKGTFKNISSDIDFIVELEKLEPTEKGENLMKLWSELEILFSRKIDLLTDKAINNPYLKKEIDNTKILIYDRAS